MQSKEEVQTKQGIWYILPKNLKQKYACERDAK